MNSKSGLYRIDDVNSFAQSCAAGKYLSLTDTFMQSVAKRISGCKYPDLISFSKVTTFEEFAHLGRFRLKSYMLKKAYMIAELDENGFDEFDDRSSIYAAWYEGQLAATIRLCPSPFESSQFIDAHQLKNFLGEHYESRYLEWSRLLIDHQRAVPRLLPAIVVYAGLQILASGNHRHYFGFSTPVVKRLFSRFLLSGSSLPFTIPRRGEHLYHLIKGDFLEDFLFLANKDFQ